MIEIIASAGIGIIVGAGLMAWRTAGKVADAQSFDGPEPECLNCADAGWVCENHPDMPWGGLSGEPYSCECGAGAPCRICQWDLATSGITDETDRAHSRITDASDWFASVAAARSVTPGANATVQRIARILRGEA